MKSVVVALGLAFVLSVCNASDVGGNELKNGEEDSATKVALDDTTTTNDPLTSEDESTVTSEDSTNETVTTVQSVTSAPSTSQNVTSAPAVNLTVTTAASVNQTTPSGGRRRLSTEIDKSKCESLGLEMPKAADCKCYKQKAAGTDTPHGFCFYYECPGNPPLLSKHKCEWIKE